MPATRWASLFLLWFLMLPVCAAQESSKEPRPKLGTDQPRKPWSFPAEAIIVVCENLQQALGAMPAGSVVLSAKQFQELQEKLAQLEKERSQQPANMVLGACRITGKITRATPSAPGSGGETPLPRDWAELRIELEFRTETPGTLVPIPLKGMRLVKATLDGEPPVWGPDSDNLSVLVKEPRVCLLVLDLLAPVQQSGAERKILLDKVPMAVVTSLSLAVPEPVRSATVRNGGPVTVERSSGQESRLKAEALGMLSRLDLTWQVELPQTPAPPRLEITGDLRTTVETTQAETVALLRFRVSQGQLTRCKVRLPSGSQDLRIDQIREGLESRIEAWTGKVTKADDSYLLTLPQSLNANDTPLTLRLRWQQKVPGTSTTPLVVAPLEILEPAECQTRGLLQATITPELRPRLVPRGLVRTEPRPDAVPATGAVFTYRYGQPAARLEILLEPAPVLPALAEVQLSHHLRITEQALQLTTELELLRTARLGVQEMEIRWPLGWIPNRNVLLQPQVEACDYDPLAGIVRIRLAGRPAAPLKVKLSGKLAAPSEQRADFFLPYLSKIRGENSGRTEAAQLLLRDTQVQIEAENLEALLEPGTTGLVSKAQPGLDLPFPLRGLTPLLAPVSVAEVAAPAPIRLRLAWQKRRPVVQSRLEIYLHGSALQVRQHFPLPARLALPPTLDFLVPRTVLPLLRFSVSGKNAEGQAICQTVTFKERSNPGRETEISVTLPVGLSGDLILHGEYLLSRTQGTGQETVPVACLRPRPSLLAVAEPVAVRCWCGAGLRLESAVAGWMPTKLEPLPGAQVPPALELQGTDLEKPLLLTVHPVKEDPLPEINAERTLVEVRPLAQGQWAYRVRLWLNQVRSSQVRLLLAVSPQHVLLENAAIQRQSISGSQWQVEEAAPGQTRLALPMQPRWLSQPLLVEVCFQLKLPASSWRYELPAPLLEGRTRQGTIRWRWETSGSEVPVWQGAGLVPERNWQWLGWITPPMPTPLAQEMSQWIDPEPEAKRNTTVELPAYSFVQDAPQETLTVVQVSPLVWCGAGSLLVLVVGWLAWQRMVPSRWLWGGLAVGLFLLCILGSETLLWALGYAVQPGLTVLAGLILFHWLRQQRWKRQIVMLPGFTRLPVVAVPSPSSAVRATPVPSGEKVS